ncbi:PQQ-dependent sugar dehydrogenase [uncultured Winogradskyella sp.]|uniref:PQQ-dependent sugar dehydrogenase n=1 Tax=uncultured Winogradskyella sp. TaxID=395353 RepID=UPI00260941B9|nr:PQQ-dependent sugar dehydrogenase [uncultured Winogradskyella sp.]
MKTFFSKKPIGSLLHFIKSKSLKFRVSLVVLTSICLLGAFPYFAGSGLSAPKAISPYANNVFPTSVDIELDATYRVAFPNLTFFYPITFRIIPNQNKVILAQLNGVIKWFDNDETTTTQNTLLDLSSEVGLVSDGGFMGLTIHPEFDASINPKNYAYIYYATKNGSGQDLPGFGQYTNQGCDYSEDTVLHGPEGEHQGNFLILEKFEIDPITMTVVPNSRTILLKNRMYGTTHFGGGLEFGNDGFLYLTTGDMASWRRSQDITDNLEGGVLRLDVDKDPTKSHAPLRKKPNDAGYADEITGVEYWIPNTNPFSDSTPGSTTNLYGQLNLSTPNPTDVYQTGDFFEEYYSIGLRNPFRMTKDSQTGIFYIGDVGLNSQEEIDVLEYGANFGWPEYEGLITGPGCDPNGDLFNEMNHTEPMTAFDRTNANSITGGFVYRGSGIPELFGKYICADYGSGGEIFSVDLDTGEYTQITTLSNVISFGEDEDGELYLLRLGNPTNIYKLIDDDVNGGDAPPVLLSQTGVFSDLTNLVVNDGFVPYELYESFWSDGALKKRWIAVPNTDGIHSGPNEQINYSEYDDWEFPPGTVIVKHFDLPIDDNNPSITKKIETRFSVVDENGEMYFLTYNWNEQQTDAVLQTSSLDEPVDIATTTGGTRTQIWHFPSNSECIDCHNEANKGGLGLKSRYLNTDYDYSTHDPNGQIANQLVTLSHLGILNQSITDTDTPNLISNKSLQDSNATLDDKARSYLDLNCAYCHRHDNDNRANFDLRYFNSLEATELLTAGILSPLGIDPNEKIVYAGDASKSILHYRMNSVDPNVMMPPLAKSIIDQPAVDLIAAWINQLDANSVNTPNDPNPIINLALLHSAQLNGSVGQGSGRGTPLDILYDPSVEDYKVTSQFSEYGVSFNHNLGTVDAENGFFWQVDWPNPKFVNYITFGGAYPNQPQPNTMWRVSYLRDGVWITIEEGQGGWINNSTGNNWSDIPIYEWDGTNEAPKVAEAIRLQLFSDGTNDLVSIHLRGRGGNTQFSNGADIGTEPKASLMQFLPFNDYTTIDSIVAGSQSSCNPNDNTYTQDLIVSYTNPPETGELLVNGQTFPITNSPQTITLTGLVSDGLDVEVQAEFTDGYKSLYNSNGTVFIAPPECINLVVGIDEDVIINSDYTVPPNGSIEIHEGGSLTINGNLTVNGQVTLNSISDKYSSLIVNGTSIGNISYKRHVNAFNGITGNDLISSPLTGDTFGNFATRNPNIFENPSNTSQKLFGPFDEANSAYTIYSTVTNANTTLVEGTGYRAARDSADDAINGTTLTFYGEIETNIVTTNLTTSGTTYNGWNLIGNPYSSYLDFDAFFAQNSSQLDTNIYQAIYGYDGDASNGWKILNNVTTGSLIAPGQGFFVKAKPGGGTVTFTPAMRVKGASDDFILGRNSTSSPDYLKLKISNENQNFTTDFYFTDEATSGLDVGYDAALFQGNAPDFSLYSTLVEYSNNEILAIQVLRRNTINDITIPLGIHALQGQEVLVSIAESDIPEDVNVYLEDTSNNTFTLLNTSNYTFTANSNLSDTGRFYLRFQNTTLSTNESTLENLNIFANKNEKSIIIVGQLQSETSIKLYDIHGRVILTKRLDIDSTRQATSVSHLSDGIYVVELVGDTGEKRTQKLVIRQ